jgi:hypothetical protein
VPATWQGGTGAAELVNPGTKSAAKVAMSNATVLQEIILPPLRPPPDARWMMLKWFFGNVLMGYPAMAGCVFPKK